MAAALAELASADFTAPPLRDGALAAAGAALRAAHEQRRLPLLTALLALRPPALCLASV